MRRMAYYTVTESELMKFEFNIKINVRKSGDIYVKNKKILL